MRKLGNIAIIILLVIVLPGVYADNNICNNSHLGNIIPYMNIEPLDYSITGGEFIALCGTQAYYWFDIFLETDSVGELIIEIPKNSLDLKQFDYLDCATQGNFYVYDEDDNAYVLSGEQIAQTDTSRTIKITWDTSVQQISYFGGAGLIPTSETNFSIGLSHPRYCILEYENNNYDPTKSIPIDQELIKKFDSMLCSEQHGFIMVYLHYTITTGTVEKICVSSYGSKLNFILDVDDEGYLILDVPNDLFSPGEFGVVVDYDDSFQRVNRNFQGDDKIGVYIKDEHGVIFTNPLSVVLYDIDTDSTKYKIPFLKDDRVFELSKTVILRESPAISQTILEQYSKPLINNFDTQLQNFEKTLCKSNFVSIMKYDNSKSVCVKPTTAEKLIQRGWALDYINN